MTFSKENTILLSRNEEIIMKLKELNIDKFDEFIKMSIETLKIIANIDKIIPTQYKKSNGQIISKILDECVFVPLFDGTEQR